MDREALAAEVADLVFEAFDEATAWALGNALVARAKARALPVAIDIRSRDRVLFHASLAGATPANDLWARRKGNVAFHFARASMEVTLHERERGRSMAQHGLSEADYAFSGGAVPVRVRGSGIVAVAVVSGLPEAEDHALVVEAMRAVLAGEA